VLDEACQRRFLTDQKILRRFPAFLNFNFPYRHRGMFSEIRSVHFVGICGTAMASTAAALKLKGYAVTGSDQNV